LFRTVHSKNNSKVFFRKHDKLQEDIGETIERELKFKEANKAKSRFIKAMLNAKSHLQEEKKEFLTKEKEKINTLDLKDFKRRRDLQLAEMKVSLIL
jgi:hypothetical protein